LKNLSRTATVPVYNCPNGTKLWILNLGEMEADEAWIKRGANISSLSNKNPPNVRRRLAIVSALIEHPTAGLLLYETGCAEKLDVHWSPGMNDVFPRILYEDKHRLPKILEALGHKVSDISAVIMGHLHIDHAGGLEHFFGSQIPIYVHDLELKNALWAIATGADDVYLKRDVDLDLNWKTVVGEEIELFQGITLHHLPGHTPGLMGMQVNLEDSGTFIFTTDQFHVRDNYYEDHPQGYLARDHNAWYNSAQLVKRLQRNFNANLVFGHCKETVDKLKSAPEYYS